MKRKTILIAGLIAAICCVLQNSNAKENEATNRGGTETKFIKRAANGGMTEVELGKIASEKGQKQEVKDFGNRMVKDHSKANDDLKSVASKMGVQVPDKVNAKHQAMIDKFSNMSSGDAFDKTYVDAMVKDHTEDIAEFERAQKNVSNADLKKFIEDTIPVMKEHLEMIKKIQNSTQGSAY